MISIQEDDHQAILLTFQWQSRECHMTFFDICEISFIMSGSPPFRASCSTPLIKMMTEAIEMQRHKTRDYLI
jgi:hypothetical protein